MPRYRWGIILGATLVACGGRTGLELPEEPCPAAFADCDDDPANGCEVDLSTDDENCGACGVACARGLACSRGACVPGDTLVQLDSMVATQFLRTADGRVLVWGSNEYGQGDPKSDAPFILQPQELDLPEPMVEVHAGYNVSCARGASGQVWCWGASLYIPGAAPGESSHDFVPVQGVSGAVALMAAWDGFCVFDPLGRGLCWSANEESELSTGSGQELPIPPDGVVEMSAVEGNLVTLFPSLAAVRGGPVLTWGLPPLLGWVSPNMLIPVLTPTAVPGLADPVRVDAGGLAYCASLRDGRVYCWGQEIGGPDASLTPFLAFEQGPYEKVSASANLCALTPTGHVECNDPLDHQVDLDGVADISASSGSLCLLMRDQRVLCKGDNSFAQQGSGTVGGYVLELTEVTIPVLH